MTRPLPKIVIGAIVVLPLVGGCAGGSGHTTSAPASSVAPLRTTEAASDNALPPQANALPTRWREAATGKIDGVEWHYYESGTDNGSRCIGYTFGTASLGNDIPITSSCIDPAGQPASLLDLVQIKVPDPGPTFSAFAAQVANEVQEATIDYSDGSKVSVAVENARLLDLEPKRNLSPTHIELSGPGISDSCRELNHSIDYTWVCTR